MAMPASKTDSRQPLYEPASVLLPGSYGGWQLPHKPGVILLRLVYFVVVSASVTKTKILGAYLLPVRPHLNSSVALLIKPHRTKQTRRPRAAYLHSAARLGALQPSSTYGSTGGPSPGPPATYVEVWTAALPGDFA